VTSERLYGREPGRNLEEVQAWFEDQAELYFQQAAEPVFGEAAALESTKSRRAVVECG